MARAERSNGQLNFPQHPSDQLPLRETIYEEISYVCPTWEEMGTYNFELSKEIIQSGQRFDRIVALARGGWTWARDLADNLKIPHLSSMRIGSYKGINEAGKPRIIQPLTDPIFGEKILLFDEVIDSGETVALAQPYLAIMGAESITTATLCCKPRSKVKPDFQAFETSSWVVFPHEIREFIEGAYDKWINSGLSVTEIHDRLITIGLPTDKVEFYLNIILNPS